MDQFKQDLKSNAEARGDLNVLRMLESRIVEIIHLEKEVKRKCPKLYSQRLPRYMRRRAASHNPYRIPKWMKVKMSKDAQTSLRKREKTQLARYRAKLRHAKHKRILKKHSRHRFKDPNKCIVHKWFAKRFKMETKQEDLAWMPVHNNTKNFRNLYRQTRYGCAYFSMGHLISFQIDASIERPETRSALNQFTRSTSGFTFDARSLEVGRYEVVIHLYETTLNEEGKKEYEHICPAFVSTKVGKKVAHSITLWVPRININEVQKILDKSKLPYVKVPPRETMRFRLAGPDARKQALRIAEEKEEHGFAHHDVDHRLMVSNMFGLTIGRFMEEKDACFTYFQTNPQSVDIVLRNPKAGRMLWHKLVKDKAHIVGGKRDVDELFKNNQLFQLKPDCD